MLVTFRRLSGAVLQDPFGADCNCTLVTDRKTPDEISHKLIRLMIRQPKPFLYHLQHDVSDELKSMTKPTGNRKKAVAVRRDQRQQSESMPVLHRHMVEYPGTQFRLPAAKSLEQNVIENEDILTVF